MTRQRRDLVTWLDFVAALLDDPLTALPVPGVEVLAAALHVAGRRG